MEEATGAPSSFTDWYTKRQRASGHDGGSVMTRPPVTPHNALFPSYKCAWQAGAIQGLHSRCDAVVEVEAAVCLPRTTLNHSERSLGIRSCARSPIEIRCGPWQGRDHHRQAAPWTHRHRQPAIRRRLDPFRHWRATISRASTGNGRNPPSAGTRNADVLDAGRGAGHKTPMSIQDASGPATPAHVQAGTAHDPVLRRRLDERIRHTYRWRAHRSVAATAGRRSWSGGSS
jgi:hypothetical protein